MSKKSVNFEKSIEKIEEISQALSNGSAPMEELFMLYEEGMKLIKDCREYLSIAELRIHEINKKFEESDKE